MRLGFVGPSRGDIATLRPLCELLLFDLAVTRVVYLGADDALDRAVRGWHERFGAPPDENAFLREAAILAREAPAEVIEALLERDRKRLRLSDLAALPPPPARAVEMFDDRVVLMVYDKAVLDEDDVANATVIAWGHAPEPQLKPIGPRIFLSPGWVTSRSGAHVAVVEQVGTSILCSLHDKAGKPVQQHGIALKRTMRMGVQSR